MRKPPPILGIALTVFIDILGFGLVIPDIQLRGEKLGAAGIFLGLTIACFSIAQLITSPILGRLSDSIGRRKILLATTAITTCSYLFYSHVEAGLWVMVVARILGGIGGGNIGVAYAYIADVTTPENRSKSMGVLGAAFGMGFIFGPGIGPMLVSANHGSAVLLGYTAAALSAINFLYVYVFLEESLKPGSHTAEERSPKLRNFARAFAVPGLGLLLVMFFAQNFGFSNLESTFFRFAKHDFGLSQAQTAYVLIEVGIVTAIMQAGIVRMLIPRFGEVNLLRVAYFLQAPALAFVPWANPWVPMLVVTGLLGVGGGLSQPSMSGLISQLAPPYMQGGIFGVTQSLGALARILGPLAANALFDVRHWMPYVLGGGMIFLPLLASWKLKLPHGQSEPVAVAG